MHYRYRQSARVAALKALFLWLLIIPFALFFTVAMPFVLIPGLILLGFKSFIGLWMIFLALPLIAIAIFFFLSGLMLFLYLLTEAIFIYHALKYGGEWEIEVTDTDLNWKSPEFSEEGFRKKLSEIQKCIRKYHSTDFDHTRYFVETTDGDLIDLSTRCGVSHHDLIDALKKAGIRYEEFNLK